MEALIPFSKILSFIGIGSSEPTKKDLTPPKLDLKREDVRYIEYNGRKIFLNSRDPNEPFPPGYEEWRDALRKEMNCYVSRFPRTSN
jgi:hypothetical protein